MYRNFLCFTFVLLTCALAGCQSPGMTKIAVVNYEKAISESEANKVVVAHLEGISRGLQEELIPLQEAAEKATSKGREAAQARFQNRLQAAQQQFNAEQQRVYTMVNDLYKRSMDTLRIHKRLEAVFDSNAAPSYNESLDITPEVIATMNRTPLQLE